MEFKFLLSINEFMFLGWLAGILEAKLVKNLQLNWKFAGFNLFITVVFWLATESFIMVPAAGTWYGQSVQFVIFLALGYGAYKIFTNLMKAGSRMQIGAISNFTKKFTLKEQDKK